MVSYIYQCNANAGKVGKSVKQKIRILRSCARWSEQFTVLQCAVVGGPMLVFLTNVQSRVGRRSMQNNCRGFMYV